MKWPTPSNCGWVVFSPIFDLLLKKSNRKTRILMLPGHAYEGCLNVARPMFSGMKSTDKLRVEQTRFRHLSSSHSDWLTYKTIFHNSEPSRLFEFVFSRSWRVHAIFDVLDNSQQIDALWFPFSDKMVFWHYRISTANFWKMRTDIKKLVNHFSENIVQFTLVSCFLQISKTVIGG